LQDVFVQLRIHGAGSLFRSPVWRLSELGEIALNLPSTSFVRFAYVLPFIGMILGALVLSAIFDRRDRLGVGEVFLLSYFAGIVLWPFYAPRFWLPVLPLVIGFAWISLRRLARYAVPRYAIYSYSAWAVFTGCVLLSSSTVISFSGPRIGDVYRTGVYDETYCAAKLCGPRDPSRDRPTVLSPSGMSTWWQDDGLRLLSDFRDDRLATGGR
jgi:hypothetical protein